MIKILKFIFHISVLFLIIISLLPGSLLGFLFYDDFGKQPDLIKNPFGTTINHFIYYNYVSLLGFFLFLKSKNFNKLVYGLFFFVDNPRASSICHPQPLFSAGRFNS